MQGNDIVAAHEMPGREREGAVAQLPARLVELAHGLRTDEAVDGETAFLLERTNRAIDLFVEGVGRAGPVEQAQTREPCPEFDDLRTAIPEAHGHRH